MSSNVMYNRMRSIGRWCLLCLHMGMGESILDLGMGVWFMVKISKMSLLQVSFFISSFLSGCYSAFSIHCENPDWEVNKNNMQICLDFFFKIFNLIPPQTQVLWWSITESTLRLHDLFYLWGLNGPIFIASNQQYPPPPVPMCWLKKVLFRKNVQQAGDHKGVLWWNSH